MALDPVTSAIESAVATADPTSAAAETLDTAADVALDPQVDAIVAPEGTEGTVDASAEGTDTAVSPSSGAAAADTAAKAAAALEAAKPVDPLDKELEALGLKAPKEGERENRLPYSRVRKIAGNAIKKTEERFQGQVTELTGRATKAEETIKTYGKVDQLITQDPDRYIGMLAALHPDKYGKFVKGGVVEGAKVPATVVPTAGEPMPPPNAKYADGSVGYDEKGLADLLAWSKREGTREAKAEMQTEIDKRLGPIENERASARMIQERVPQVRNRIEQAKKDWGPLFEADYNLANEGKSEILQMMQANDGQEGRPLLAFETCVARVLLPKMQKDRDAMRTSILEEMKGRPAAAVRTPAAPAKAAVDVGPKTTEDIIRESIRGLK